ncbi:MAG: helix-turn-helix transcriptional regulator, partial [Bacteroidota bacterium]
LRIRGREGWDFLYPEAVSYGFYHIGLKRNLQGYVKYGRTTYDFQEGVMGFSAPGQEISYSLDAISYATGWMLWFDKRLFKGHPLAGAISTYGFFGYQVNEALHLSKAEEDIMEGVFSNIQEECSGPIDAHSRNVLLSNLELLLTYSNRFYTRQFRGRNEADSSIQGKFEKVLSSYFDSNLQLEKGLPTVQYLAEQLHVSPNYLSDTLKILSGKSTQEHIHLYLMERAKGILLGTELSISEVAFKLGFEYPQYFSRLFKDKVGITPNKYRSN